MRLDYGFWNVRSLNQAGAMTNLIDELKKYSIVIAAMQEIKWRGNDVFYSGDYTIRYSGSSGARNVFGTGFFVHKKLKQYIMKFKPVDGCLCHLRMKGKFFNNSLICAHVLTQDKGEYIKSVFYEKLDRLHPQTRKHYIKIIVGDMNAKIGKDPRVPYVGHHSLHDEFNTNGIMMTDFAVTRKLVISSTKFPHKSVHKEIWISPDGRTRNQVDHVMIDEGHAKNIIDVGSYTGA
jgi:mRNA deadenylase 3'-5' endonuclease subunit Ccr4